MDQRTFHRLTKEIFTEYGFVKKKSKYVLVLNDVTITVYFGSWHGIKSFNYCFYLNHFYDPSLGDENPSDLRIWKKIVHDPSAGGYHEHEILFEQYTEDEYRNMLNQMLHSCFDPYRHNALQHIKDCYHKDESFPLSERSRIFLDLIDYEKGKEILTEGKGKIPLYRFDEYKSLQIPKNIEAQWIAEIQEQNGNKNTDK